MGSPLTVKRRKTMEIRTALPEDLEAITRLEAECFPPLRRLARKASSDGWNITPTISGF